jgi:hypothetical protein
VEVTDNEKHSSLIFAGKDRAYPNGVNKPGIYSREGSSLACKYQTRVEVTDNEKHYSLIFAGKAGAYPIGAQ